MTLLLDEKEAEFYQRFLELKTEAGNHSPSIYRLLEEFPEVSIQVDACFLCNPYAFKIFFERLQSAELESYVKFYPPQNEEIAKKLSVFSGVPPEQILVGNGAIQLIEEIMQMNANKRVCMVQPTFSTYYEIAEKISHCFYYQLLPESNFELDVDRYIQWLEEVNPDVVVLVNPNNPTGTLIDRADVIRIWNSLRKDQLLVLDESFIHFAPGEQSIEKLSAGSTNLIIIRSLSKDFGIAGLRMGYAVMPTALREKMLSTGFLWNSNGLAYYFSTLLSDPAFLKNYQRSRSRYNEDRDAFYQELCEFSEFRVRKSSANFFMLETTDEPGILFSKLLYGHGIYSRILNDKVGLRGNFLRLASKDQRENRKIVSALKQIYHGSKK